MNTKPLHVPKTEHRPLRSFYAKRLLKHLREGGFPDMAAAAAGLDPIEVQAVLEAARCSRPPVGYTETEHELARRLRKKIDEAVALAENDAVQKLRRALSAEDISAAKFFLERRFGDRWGKKDKLNIVETKLNVDVRNLSDSEILMRLGQLGLAPAKGPPPVLQAPADPAPPAPPRDVQ